MIRCSTAIWFRILHLRIFSWIFPLIRRWFDLIDGFPNTQALDTDHRCSTHCTLAKLFRKWYLFSRIDDATIFFSSLFFVDWTKSKQNWMKKKWAESTRRKNNENHTALCVLTWLYTNRTIRRPKERVSAVSLSRPTTQLISLTDLIFLFSVGFVFLTHHIEHPIRH